MVHSLLIRYEPSKHYNFSSRIAVFNICIIWVPSCAILPPISLRVGCSNNGTPHSSVLASATPTKSTPCTCCKAEGTLIVSPLSFLLSPNSLWLTTTKATRLWCFQGNVWNHFPPSLRVGVSFPAINGFGRKRIVLSSLIGNLDVFPLTRVLFLLQFTSWGSVSGS